MCARRALVGELQGLGDPERLSRGAAVRKSGRVGAHSHCFAAVPAPRGSGPGASLRSSSSSGLLCLWPRARPQAGCDCLGQIDSASRRSPAALSRWPSTPDQQSAGRGRSALRNPLRLRVCGCGGGGRADGVDWPALPGNARVIGAGSWQEAKAVDVVGHRRPLPTCLGWTLGPGRKRRKGCSRRASVRPRAGGPIVKLPNSSGGICKSVPERRWEHEGNGGPVLSPLASIPHPDGLPTPPPTPVCSQWVSDLC